MLGSTETASSTGEGALTESAGRSCCELVGSVLSLAGAASLLCLLFLRFGDFALTGISTPMKCERRRWRGGGAPASVGAGSAEMEAIGCELVTAGGDGSGRICEAVVAEVLRARGLRVVVRRAGEVVEPATEEPWPFFDRRDEAFSAACDFDEPATGAGDEALGLP